MADFEDLPFERHIHLRIPTPTDEEKAAIKRLRDAVIEKAEHLYKSHSEWASDEQFQRFLIARNYNQQASLDLMVGALKWREQRQPARIESLENWEAKMSRESETGKIYCPGLDRWQRPVLIFDNTVQNTPHVDDHMQFLAWNLEFATRQMPPHVDKYLVFMHLTNFSIFNTPPFNSTRETIHMLCNCFPERLGHCIVYQPPRIFRTFFNTVKGFIDPKTVSKMVFIIGDVSEGSENDLTMKMLIGDNWKELTGAEQPVHAKGNSPGYIHEVYWPTVRQRIDRLASSSSLSTSAVGDENGSALDTASEELPTQEQALEENVDTASIAAEVVISNEESIAS